MAFVNNLNTTPPPGTITNTPGAGGAKGTETVGETPPGGGIIGTDGGPPPDIGVLTAYGALMGSLFALMPQMSSEEISLKLVEVTNKLKKTMEESEIDKIKSDTEKKRDMIGEKQAKIEEAQKKMDEAQEAREKASIWDKIKLAFQALGAALMVLAGIFMATIPGFQVVGGLMIAAGVVGIISMIDAATKTATGLGIAGNLDKLANPDKPEGWAVADTVFGASLAVAGLALAIATIFVPGPKDPTEIARALSNLVKLGSGIASAAIGAATAAGDITTGVIKYVAAEKEAGAKTTQAETKEMEAIIAQMDDFIDMALARLMATTERFNEMLDSLTDAIQDRGNSLSRARFSA